MYEERKINKIEGESTDDVSDDGLDGLFLLANIQARSNPQSSLASQASLVCPVIMEPPEIATVELIAPEKTLASRPYKSCDHVCQESGNKCTNRVISKGKCGKHGGGKRCNYMHSCGSQCSSRAHSQGRCSIHGGSRCQMKNCGMHYVLDKLCTFHFHEKNVNNASQIARLRDRQAKRKKN